VCPLQWLTHLLAPPQQCAFPQIINQTKSGQVVFCHWWLFWTWWRTVQFCQNYQNYEQNWNHRYCRFLAVLLKVVTLEILFPLLPCCFCVWSPTALLTVSSSWLPHNEANQHASQRLNNLIKMYLVQLAVCIDRSFCAPLLLLWFVQLSGQIIYFLIGHFVLFIALVVCAYVGIDNLRLQIN